MLTRYKCPDGKEREISQCLNGCITNERFECGRCLSYRMLREMASEREWSGMPTVTQLLSGTRAEYLKITKEYAVTPQSMIAAYLGSSCHAQLEQAADEGRMLREKRLLDPTGTYTGQFDCYDTQEKILYDTKTYGSYKAAQVLGVEAQKKAMLNPATGEFVLTPRGKMRYEKSYVRTVRKMREVTLQLNAYRIMLEAAGYPVKEMRLEIIVRDGGTWLAKDRGVFQNAYLVKINRVSDRWLQRFMLAKARMLTEALKAKKMPPPCRPIECWGGLKCKDFCAVEQFCREDDGN